jgi:DeoR/GlpR family transcriptional regulator of sugar metabolism
MDMNEEQLEDMLPEQRRQRLLDWFADNVAASSQDLARMFNTSVSTIRRDLDQLASQGLVRRTHGGAVRIRRRATFEPSTDVARQTATEEKRAIAIEAARRLEPDQSIFVDTSTTLHEFAHVVAGLTIPLTVVTIDIYVARILCHKPHIKLIVPGGTCREGSYALLGEPGLSFLKDMRCDHLFLSSQAVDLECVSDTSLDLVQLKRAMIEGAETTTLLVDSSKFSTRAIYRIASLDKINEIITDEGLNKEEREKFGLRGIKITYAPLPENGGDGGS